MIDVLNISIPFFALIFLGFGAHAIGFIDAAGARTMSKFAFYVTLPPYMFLKVSASEPSSILNWDFVWRYECGTIIMYLSAAAIGYWLFRLKPLESGIFGLNVAYPNYGYMGIPLSILAFGNAAALPMALILFADTIVLLALTSCFVAGNDGGVTESVKRIAITMASNPLVLAVMAGLLFSASGLPLPQIPQQFGSLLAGAAAPVALFALGATLFGQPVRAAAGEVTAISLLKLIVHPLLVALFFLGYRVKTRFGSRLQFYRAACRLPRMFSCLPIIMVPIRGAPHRPFWSARFLPAPPCRSFYIGCFMGKANLPNKSSP